MTTADLEALLKLNRRARTRHQEGNVFEKCNVLYIRFYADRMISGQRQRVKVTEKLGAKDATHFISYKKRAGKQRREIVLSPALRRLRDQRMIEVNAVSTVVESEDQLVSDFWTNRYLPWIQEKKRNSTTSGYAKIWRLYLEKHYRGRTLSGYRTSDGTRFLESLAERLGRHSLAHVRSLASGIFTRAVNDGLIERNPWSEVSVESEKESDEDTHAYTIEESVAILKALSPRLDATLIFSLCRFLTLNPSEAVGVRWENIDGIRLHVRQTVVNGNPEKLKAKKRKRSLPLIEPVRSLLAAWREVNGGVSTGWLFTNGNGAPVNSNNFAQSVIKPMVREAGLEWHGLYAGRRGAGTDLFNLVGDATAAYQALGNSLAVVQKHYVKPSTAAGERGLRLLEATIKNALQPAPAASGSSEGDR
jgi:integrase